jgi:hypothetical protein
MSSHPPSRCAAGVLCFLAVCYPGLPQSGPVPGARPPAGRTSRTASQTRESGAIEGEKPLATFSGTLKSIESKSLMLQRPDAQPLEFHVSRKTSFFAGTKKVKSSDVKQGDAIVVEAQVSPNGKLDAVNVRVTRDERSSGAPAGSADRSQADRDR